MANSNSSEIIVTHHAYKRAKERLSFSNAVLNKMAAKAFDEGITHSNAKGNLRKYIDKIWFMEKTANQMRIYGENLYLFSNNVLITVYKIPSNLKKLIKISKKID